MIILYEILRWIIQILVAVGLAKALLYFALAPFYPVMEEKRKQRYLGNSKRPYTPSLSVIVPAWNEEVGVLKTIKSLLANKYPSLQIVVVNDGSTDKTGDIVQNFIKNGLKNNQFEKDTITYIYQENGGKGKALNTGIKNAKGDIILTMDADSAITEHGLQRLVQYFADPEIMGVVGNVQVASNTTLVGMAQRFEYIFGFYFKRAHAIMGAEYIFGGACAAYRSEVFEKIGLFDEKNKTEDIEMSMRSRLHGMKCTYAEDVVVYTEGASDTRGLLNQRLRWKKGRFDTFAKYSNLFFSTEEKHNSFLSFFVLPIALIDEILLFFAPIALSTLLVYSFISYDFLALLLNILFLGIYYLVNGIFGAKAQTSLLLLFPFTWVFFYYLIWIEYMALLKSLTMMFRKQDVKWQKWKRVGIQKELQ